MRIFLLLSGMLLIGGPHSAPERPNIVWLTIEDSSAIWCRLYHPSGAEMPNIERLAKNGLVFNNAFSNAPVCSVARSTIISGCYAPRLGVQYHRKQKQVPMPDGLRMFPWYLRRAGYHTTNCSKEDYNFTKEAKEGVWDLSAKKATYRNRKPGQPFFHVQNYGTTHESCMHGRMKIGAPVSRDPKSIKVFPYHPDTETFRYSYAHYLEQHKKIDEQLGGFIKQIEDDGLLDDTFIFFYGDHGGVLPRSKGYIYESGLQVPMVVYIPKNWQHLAPAPPGSRINGFVQFVDLSATVLNLAGVEPPKGIDGRPFLGKGVTLKELDARDTTFGYADRFDEKWDLVRTFRKGQYKYMRNYQPFNVDGLYNRYRYIQIGYREWLDLYKAGKLNEEQKQFFEPRPAECLYDLSTDPHEVKNLATDPAHRKTLLTMRGLLQSQVKGMPDLSMIPENVFLEEGAQNPVAYGQKKKAEIARLVDIADLGLLDFSQAKAGLEAALGSTNPHEQYWGLIACSSFGKQASPLYAKAKEIASDTKAASLVRMRAAEFLALTGQADPQPVINEILRKSTSQQESTFILNSVVLLRDWGPRVPWDLKELAREKKWNKSQGLLGRRIEYLVK